MPKSTMTLMPYGVEDIKSSYYQKIYQPFYQLKQAHLMELKNRVDSLPKNKTQPKTEPKDANLRLYCEFFENGEIMFEVGIGQSTNAVVINNQVWKDNPEFYEELILKLIDRN
jgi:hypothetical protein